MKITIFIIISLLAIFVACDDITNNSQNEKLYYSLPYDSFAYHYYIPQINPPNLHTRFSYFRAEFDFRTYNKTGTISAGQIGNWQSMSFDTNGHYNITFNFSNPVDSTIFPFNSAGGWNDTNAYAVFENLKVYIR